VIIVPGNDDSIVQFLYASSISSDLYKDILSQLNTDSNYKYQLGVKKKDGVFYLLNESSNVFSALNGNKKTSDDFDKCRGIVNNRGNIMVSLRWQLTERENISRCCYLLLTQPVESLFSQLKSLENTVFVPDNSVEVNSPVIIELSRHIECKEKKNALKDIEFPNNNSGKVFAVIG